MMIRKAIQSELEEIKAIIHGAFSKYIDRMGKKPAPMVEEHEDRIANDELYVALSPENEMLGLVILIIHRDHVLLDTIAVKNTAQNSGIGSALIAFSEKHTLAHARPEMRLNTNVFMTENQGWYLRRGFEEMYRVVEDGYHRIYYRKSIASKTE